ncbi:hypothetical protein QBC34DRAFT_408052 [Podospora aff. communis PSN243]|uniref:RRM domain-containing protein n=1 Tax=Podospora aff. communis PSN243 TaxID=3040156 RepID=A0AAV9GHS9_9PEZI|nr:hypothetical protein QBC34DRAFT_408052 [Podospora aff. communis PSN243]
MKPTHQLQFSQPWLPVPPPIVPFDNARQFQRTAMVARRGQDTGPSQTDVANRLAAGVSIYYRGNLHQEQNFSANIPPEDSCSFWLTNLPPNCTVHQLLSSIRGFGRV